MKTFINNMMDMEADLGSDNEENDNVVKKIDMDKENEEEKVR